MFVLSALLLSLVLIIHNPLVHSQSGDPSEILIWSCKSNGVNTYYYDPAVIRFYAQTATEINIRSNLDPNAYVKTTPNSYALDSLRLGKSLSYTPSGAPAIPSGWTGPMSANMWNSCGQTDTFINSPYWSCNNGNGLHLRPDFCGWSTNVATPGGISIFIKRQLNAPVPIWRCYSDGVNVPLVTTTAGLNAIGKNTAAITIYATSTPTDYVATASSSSYAIQSLTQGSTLSYTTSSGFAVTSDWVGSALRKPSDMLWNSCGSNQGFLSTPYWSCNNGNGLHLTPQTCGWTSAGKTPGGLTVAVTQTTPAPYRLVRIWSCSAPGNNSADYSLADIKILATKASGIVIMTRNNPEEYVATKNANSYALASLKIGKSISFTTTGGNAIVDDWIGTKTTQIWNSCGTSADFTNTPYWSCNNGNGLHLTPTSCGWTSDSAAAVAGGIGVYLQFPVGFTAAFQGTTLYVIDKEDESWAHPTTVVTALHSDETTSDKLVIGLSIGATAFVVLAVVVIVIAIVVIQKKQQSPDDYLIHTSL